MTNKIEMLAKKITTYCTWKEHDKNQIYDVSEIYPSPDDLGDNNLNTYAKSEEVKNILQNNYVFLLRKNSKGLRKAYEIKDSKKMNYILSNIWDQTTDTIFIIQSKDRENQLTLHKEEIRKVFEEIGYNNNDDIVENL